MKYAVTSKASVVSSLGVISVGFVGGGCVAEDGLRRARRRGALEELVEDRTAEAGRRTAEGRDHVGLPERIGYVALLDGHAVVGEVPVGDGRHLRTAVDPVEAVGIVPAGGEPRSR